ncbi:MAG: hypothetical protein M1827_007075 [Pycnora praestabilis]|nr:MAG: hypothetical protein M1827_007075 [Pycnora praestabilis]
MASQAIATTPATAANMGAELKPSGTASANVKVSPSSTVPFMTPHVPLIHSLLIPLNTPSPAKQC